MGGWGVGLQLVLSPLNFKFLQIHVESMIMARDSSWKMTHGLTMVPFEFSSLCADDGSLHLHVFLGSGMCSPRAFVARE